MRCALLATACCAFACASASDVVVVDSMDRGVAPPPALTGRPVFPAVYRAVRTLFPTAGFAGVDVEHEQFQLEDLEFKDGLTRRRMSLSVTLDHGALDYAISQEEAFDERRFTWVSSDVYVFTSARKQRGLLDEAIREGFMDPGAYAVGLDAALSDLAFLHRCLGPLDDAARSTWVAQELSSKAVDLAVTIRTVRDLGPAASARYEVEALPAPQEGTSGVTDEDVLVWDTRDPRAATLSPGAVDRLRGHITAVDRTARQGLHYRLTD